MRSTANGTLPAYLNSLRGTDAQLYMADCYTVTLLDGTALYYTNFDLPITLGANVFLANSVRIDGLKYNCKRGTEADEQKITIIALPSGETIGGVPILAAIAAGVLDGATVRRERAFCNSWSEADRAAPIDSVVLFHGRVATVDGVGRTTADITVHSDLVLLDINMPRKIYAPGCMWALYGFGCGLSKADFTSAGTVGGGPTQRFIPWSGATANYAQGTLIFTSGVLNGISATIKSVAGGAAPGFVPIYPLPASPAPGDTFAASFGCDRTKTTCQSRFNNLANFLGFPYVPPPTFSV
ncbi:hypothetical protein CWB41_14035 [Methylovirgula ligni]|uniref:Putative phage protein (TIGR02218 family) n=1 Tax=Methylovirgula ligni TaxID=569860 RepID=A0A3D9YKZ0_9HYPH|nr:DUF2163 domain-containing protein [Methylovirgula ligni]QAY96713.1 hypothetical protein CWB41_14035 [Methylovirgula ligni]REF83247.1 putative phage protein (TIGR02218 family) [Methylovirgula ligni]